MVHTEIVGMNEITKQTIIRIYFITDYRANVALKSYDIHKEFFKA